MEVKNGLWKTQCVLSFLHLADVLVVCCRCENHSFVNLLSGAFLDFWCLFGKTEAFAIITQADRQADTPDRRTRRPDQTTGFDVFLVYSNCPLLFLPLLLSAAHSSAPSSFRYASSSSLFFNFFFLDSASNICYQLSWQQMFCLFCF